MADGVDLRVFTIGHSNHALEVFTGLLKMHSVAVVVDVRSYPYSNYSPHFDRENLRPSIAAAGMRYLYLGGELGGRPKGDRYYDRDGHVLYGEVAASPEFQHGLERLRKGLAEFPIALLCSEEDPAACHRRLLIGRVLGEQGVAVLHIRGDGRVETEEEVAARVDSAPTDQLSLFEEKPEAPQWKSIPSVSPRRRQNSSSAF